MKLLTLHRSSFSILLLRLLGFLLLLPAFLPLEAAFGKIADAQGMMAPEAWALGGVLLLACAYVLSRILPRLAEGVTARLAQLPESFFTIVLPILQFTLAAFVAQYAFHARPHLVDEVVQIFQAKIFASGALTAPSPKLPQFFVNQHIVLDGERWYGQYPPGHSALLAVFSLVSAEWLLCPLLSALTVFAMYKFAREAFSPETARLASLLLLFTPFFMFVSASLMNHAPLLFFESIALWQFAKWERYKTGQALVLVGASLGVAFLIRPLCALSIGVVFTFWALPLIQDKKSIVHTVISGALGGAIASFQLFFNKATTGEFFLPGYIKLWGKAHDLGFHTSPWGEGHTPLRGLINQVVNVAFLNEYAFEWPVPSLVFVALFLLLLPKELGRWDRRLLLLSLAFPTAYFFYWHRDSYLGPRFMYGAIPVIVILTVQAVRSLERKAPSLPTAALLIGMLFTATLGAPQRLQIYGTSFSSMKFDLRPLIQKAGVTRAVIFIPVSWGGRMIAQLRGLGYSAYAVETAYRNSDHCVLQEFIEQKGSAPANDEELHELRSDRVKKIGITPDSTLRLDPTRVMSERCREEIRHDLEHPFTIYPAHFLLNEPDMSGSIIVAIDLRRENYKLIKEYQDRPVFILRQGRLIEYRPDEGI